MQCKITLREGKRIQRRGAKTAKEQDKQNRFRRQDRQDLLILQIINPAYPAAEGDPAYPVPFEPVNN